MKVALVGLSALRAKGVVEAIEASSSLSLEGTVVKEGDPARRGGFEAFDAVFLGTELGDERLSAIVEDIRRANPRLPVVLTYGAEPNGKVFALASAHDCWLFSEIDRVKRGLTPEEIGEELRAKYEAGIVGSRLMEISLNSGPCSTGG